MSALNEQQEAVFAKLRGIIADAMVEDEERVTLETNLARDLGVDSMDRVELIIFVEKDFDISILDEEMEGIETVRGWVEIIAEKLAEPR